MRLFDFNLIRAANLTCKSFLIIFVCFTLIFINNAKANFEPAYISTFKTEIHSLLDATRNEGVIVEDKSYKLFDKLIYQTKSSLEAQELLNKDDYSKNEAIKVLETIANTLKEEGFKIEEITFIAQALEQKTYDCDTGSEIYLSILEALEIPLNVYMVELPDHVFLKWRNAKESFNWEVLQSKVVSEEFYRGSYNFNQEDIDNKLFMRELSKKAVRSHNLQTLGLYFYEKHKYLAAIKSFTKAIDIDNINHKAFNNRGLVFNKLRIYEMAQRDFEAAIKLHPKLAHIYYNLANVYLRKQNYVEAYMNYSKAINIDPDFDLAKSNMNLLSSYVMFTGKRLL